MMKRALACLLLLLPLIVPSAQADSGRALTVWAADRVITSPVEVLGNDHLEIHSGVNIIFDADGSADGPPLLHVGGGLTVCGTAGRPVAFNSTPALWALLGEPECLYVQGNGGGDHLAVRNASFTDLVIGIFNGSGEFRDCMFDRCQVDIQSSAIRFIGCTFIFSPVAIDRYSFAPNASQTLFRECRFESYGSGSHPPDWKNGEVESGDGQYYGEAAIEDWSGARIEDCTVTGYSPGIVSGPGSVSISGCTIEHCSYGMSLWSDIPDAVATVRDCTVTGCLGTGIFVSGSVRMSNCTVSGCTDGIELYGQGNAVSVIEGNSVYGNSQMGMIIYGKEPELSGNFFGNGSSANGWGNLNKRTYAQVRATDPLGHPVICKLNWTDALGNTDSRDIDGSFLLDVLEYSINNQGQRTDRLPYTLNAELAGLTNRTTFEGGYYNITLVLQLLADLAPLNISPWPGGPVDGDKAAFAIRLENTGYYPADRGSVLFLLDGREFDRQDIPLLKGGRTITVHSRDWTATAGRHTLRAVLDPDGNISESDSNNNGIFANFTVEKGLRASFGGGTATYVPIFIMAAVMALAIFGRMRPRRYMPVDRLGSPVAR